MPELKNIFQLCSTDMFFFVFCFVLFFYSFQDKLHQSTNTYNYHGNGSKVGRSGCSNPDESFGYYDMR